MKARQERYIERDDLRDATHLEITVSYTKGGANYFSGGVTPRGFYLSVNPVKKGERSVCYRLFSGQSELLFEAQRYTAKQFARAVEMAKSREEALISAVVMANKAA